MRIAVVVAFFDPTLDYLETTLARVLSEHEDVHVITSNRRAPTLASVRHQDLQDFPTGTLPWGSALVHRVPTWIQVGQRTVSAHVSRVLETTKPDLIVQIVPAQLFSIPATAYGRRHGVPVVYVSGENSQQGPQQGWGRRARQVYLRTAWRMIARYTAGRANRVVATTPETHALLRNAVPGLGPDLVPLPYRTDRFQWDPVSRAAGRRRLEAADEFVTLVIGRCVPGKRIESIVADWELHADASPRSRLVIAGLTDDEYSRSLRALAARSRHAASVTLMPFARAETVNELLNAADAGVWPTVSVGIQQSLGTGLPAVIPRTSVGAFLLDYADGLGQTYDPNSEEGLATALDRVQASTMARPERATAAQILFGDDAVVRRIIRGLV